MPPLTLLIKPVSGSCNLRCGYCFYHSIAENRTVQSYGTMSDETLELLVHRALEYAEGTCSFAFQGGEPTLAGPGFYKRLVDLVKAGNTKKVHVSYSIQTNGILLNDEWAGFLSENNFLVGISLDGPRELHDSMRTDSGGKGTYNRVMQSIRLLEKRRVEYNILCVVNANTARHTHKVYNFFKSCGFKYLQFIPCLDPLGEKPGDYPHSLTPERYSAFLKNLFDSWYEDMMKNNPVSIRYFDNLVGMVMGYPPEACGMSGICSAYFLVEADGSVFPCDFYVIDEWYMGNISEKSLKELKDSEAAKSFTGVSTHISEQCRKCRFFNLCRGGCRRNREPFVDGKPDLNYFCSSYLDFFDYAYDRLVKLATAFSNR